MMPSVTSDLAAFVQDAPKADSHRATEVVKQAVLDLFGVIVAGAGEDAGWRSTTPDPRAVPARARCSVAESGSPRRWPHW
jgi:hypothetical protein